MNASDDTPRSGENVSDASTWEQIGRQLLQSELEQVTHEVWEAYGQTAERVGRGRELRYEDLERLWHAQHELRMVMELVEDAANVDDEIARRSEISERDEDE